MLLPPPPSPTQLAKALYDFQGQSDREISFNKVRAVITMKINQADALF